MVVGEVENGELRVKKWLHYSSNDSAAIFLFYIVAKQLHVRISTLNSPLSTYPSTTECYFVFGFSAHTSSLAGCLHSHGW